MKKSNFSHNFLFIFSLIFSSVLSRARSTIKATRVAGVITLLLVSSFLLLPDASSSFWPWWWHPRLNTLPVEHSVWVEDWTENLDTSKFIETLPQGVNTINVFVGELALVDGQPAINGYTLDTPGQPAGTGAFPDINALTDFVKQCKDAGVSVKLSIGGQSGTTFGNSWNILTQDNINDFAKTLVSLCNTTTADGIDFDEELEDTSVAALAGKLAAAFKNINANLATSYCVYGGCSSSGPMHETNTEFLANAVTSQGSCAIDRVYVMTYYDGSTLEQNEGYMTAWLGWLQKEHGFTASRISAGVDPTDPTTSSTDNSLTTWIDFAAQNGFGTAIWDQQGVDNYVDNDWGTQIATIYDNASPQ